MTSDTGDVPLIVSDCLYHTFSTFPFKVDRYACTIIEVNGEVRESREYSKHLEGKTNADVEIVRFMRTKTLTRLPRGIGGVFPNARALIINDCKISAIEREDFRGLESLTELIVQHAPISFIGSDTFAHLTQIEILIFFDTRLTTIDERVFDPLKNLKAVHMLQNTTVNAAFAASNQLWPDDNEEEPYTRAPSLDEFRKIVRGRSPCDSVCADLRRLLADDSRRDLTIVVKEANYHGPDCRERCCNEIVRVHRFLVAARCPKLEQMAEACGEGATLVLVDMPTYAFKRVVEYFYSGIVPSLKRDTYLRLRDLLEIAEKLEIEELVKYAKKELEKGNERGFGLVEEHFGVDEKEQEKEENEADDKKENEHENNETECEKNTEDNQNGDQQNAETEEEEKTQPSSLNYRQRQRRVTEEMKDWSTDDFVKIEYEDQYEIIEDFYDEVCTDE